MKMIIATLALLFYLESVLYIISGKVIEGSLLLIATSVFDYVNKDLWKE